jgi:KDO2-lipid IV(A) lauroyltransferase
MNLLRRINRRYLVRYRVEYAAVLLMLHLLRSMSPAFAWRFARAVGRLFWRLRIRRNVVLTNLKIAFPNSTPAQRERIGRRTFEHFASMAIDVLFQRRMLSRRNLYRRIRIVGWWKDYLRRHGEDGLRRRSRRMLYTTGHFGNWELSTGVFNLMGVEISPVYRMPQNPWVARIVRDIRLDAQARFIERRGAIQEMVDLLDAGGNIGFLFDQEAVHGSEIPFFGLGARTHKTPAVLALDHRVGIVFGVMARRGDFLQYEMRGVMLDPPQPTGDRRADRLAFMTGLNRLLETEIRRDPEQYLWGHRRWKRVGAHGEDHGQEKELR